MKYVAPLLLALLLLPGAGRANDDSPHKMLKADGEVDTAKCAVCHDEEMGLSRSKLETCTLCHSATLHSGVADHLRANAVSVKARLQAVKKGEPDFPLTDDGQIYCGTCHIFHDPAVSNDTPLSSEPVRSSAPVARAVRDRLARELPELAKRYGQNETGATLADRSTRMLRLPINDGSLCRHCHESYGK
jgi:hypothetical protein